MTIDFDMEGEREMVAEEGKGVSRVAYERVLIAARVKKAVLGIN